MNWYRAYVGTVADVKIAEAAMVSELPRCLIVAVWFGLLESASDDEAAGAFSVTPRRLAAALAEPVGRIEATFAALTEVGMIRDGRVVKWGERQFESDAPSDAAERQRRSRARRGGRIEAPELPLEGAGAAAFLTISQPVTTCHDESRRVTASESETDSETESSSSVVVPFTRERTDDEEILLKTILGALSGRVDPVTARAGVREVRRWIGEGCDLERDVAPELRAIAAKLTNPLKSFAAPWLREQVLARARQREAVAKAARAPPPGGKLFVADGTPEFAARVAAGHKAALNYAKPPDPADRRRGWYFPADGPSAAAEAQAQA